MFGFDDETELNNFAEQLVDENSKLQKRLEAYQHTINKIDDFFEYANESKKDRDFIHKVLDNLTLKLSTIK